jgi:hypothetical protein
MALSGAIRLMARLSPPRPRWAAVRQFDNGRLYPKLPKNAGFYAFFHLPRFPVKLLHSS